MILAIRQRDHIVLKHGPYTTVVMRATVAIVFELEHVLAQCLGCHPALCCKGSKGEEGRGEEGAR